MHVYNSLSYVFVHSHLSSQDFVSQKIGQRFIEPQTADLSLAYKDSSPTSPLIFILSVGEYSELFCLVAFMMYLIRRNSFNHVTGTDPAADLYKFAEEMKFLKKLTAISLGQGQVHGLLLCAGLYVVLVSLCRVL